MASILCWNRNRPRGPINEVRIIEFVLCMICLIVEIGKRLHMGSSRETFVIMFSITFLYSVITLIDILVICTWWPIGWRAWLLFSIIGALFFFTCAGLTFVIHDSLAMLYLVLFLITGLVFLVDGLCILWLVQKVPPAPVRPCLPPSERLRARQVAPKRDDTAVPTESSQLKVARNNERYRSADIISTDSCQEGRCSRANHHGGRGRRRNVDEDEKASVSEIERGWRKTGDRSGMGSENESGKNRHGRRARSSLSCGDASIVRHAKSSRVRHGVSKGIVKPPVAVSYGGTFHVSRDIAPLPSPFPAPITASAAESYFIFNERSNTAKKSARIGFGKSTSHKIDDVDLTPLVSPFVTMEYSMITTKEGQKYIGKSGSAIN